MENDEIFDEYKSEQDELNESETYLERYGFEHECRCAQDWAEGNWAVVSVCYVSMCGDALDKLEEVYAELKAARATIAELKMGLSDAEASS